MHAVNVNPNRYRDLSTAKYASFFMLDGNSSGNRVLDQAITNDIDQALSDKRLVDASPEEADAVVVTHVATPQQHSREAFYTGWGGWHWRNADTTATADDLRNGTLVIDMFDARTKNLIWNATAPRAIPSSTTNAHLDGLDKTITGMLKNFAWPPLTTPGSSPDLHLIFSTSPAILIRIQGEPVYRDVAGTRLQRVVNTPAVILRDESATYFMKLGDRWLEAYNVIGPWSIAGMLPEGASASTSGEPTTDIPDRGPIPEVYVATTPTELIVTDGEPQFAPVGDTSLTYIKNTNARVFREPTDKELYVSVGGRWLRSWTTNGPWEEIRAEDLPADLKGR
jgi:hypothetical protein